MKKRILFILSAFVLVLGASFLPLFPQEAKSINPSAEAVTATKNYDLHVDVDYAQSSVVMDMNSGSILYSKNASLPRGMASTTKIMTALVAIENCSLDTEFNIPKEAVGIEGSSVYLLEGEPLTLRELLYCLLLESGNDAATAIAICCGGDLESFVDLMNQRAEEMGLTNTHFTNPHGLSHENHYTTATELAKITAEAMQYPIFCEIVATKTAKVRYDGVANGRSLTNHNKLLFGFEGATGVKTGYTKLDGKCLVSSAERDGLHLICVTLHDSSPTSNHIMLLNKAFSEFQSTLLAEKGDLISEIPVNGGESQFVTVANLQRAQATIPKGASVDMQLFLSESVDAPVEEGQIIGEARFFCDGEEVYIINLESTETVNLQKIKKKNFWEKIFGD